MYDIKLLQMSMIHKCFILNIMMTIFNKCNYAKNARFMQHVFILHVYMHHGLVQGKLPPDKYLSFPIHKMLAPPPQSVSS